MKKMFRRAVCLLTIGILTFQGPVLSAKAEVVDGENSIGGFAEALDRYYSSIKEQEEADTTELYATAYEAPENLAIADVSSVLNIRKKASTSSSKVGILAKNGACIVESIDENGWAKVTSGEVEGYVYADYLIMGEEAVAIAEQSAVLYATVNSKVSALNVRTEPSTTADVITKVKAGERLVVTKEVVINKDDATSQVWVEVKMDDDENENAVAYVSADYVTVSYELNWASKYTPYGPDVSDLRVSICDYAKKWIGTKYVWGGNSLTKGIDCSGFVQQVYKNFGYSTPRVSRDMAKKYTKISIDELKPGDLIFYGRVKDNYINHVGIYIGNGQVIHSSTNYKGVAISSMYFYSILKCARIIKD